MAEAYIVDAVRTPVGKKKGGLSQVHPADMGAHVLKSLLSRNDLDPLAVEDVVFGCLDTIGPQAGDIARTCWLAAGLPLGLGPVPCTSVPPTTASFGLASRAAGVLSWTPGHSDPALASD